MEQKKENHFENVTNIMTYLLWFYFTSNLEEYVEAFLEDLNLYGKEGDRCKTINIKRSDISNMLEDFMLDMIDDIDIRDFKISCTDDLIEYIRDKRSDVMIEDDSE